AADLHLYDPDWRADILHSHDWQGGLAPLYSQLSPQKTPPKTVLTIHNIAYQGLFSAQHLAGLGLPMEFYKAEGVEYYQKIGFLKAGIFYADQITTVSPRYAAEIQTADFGCGLEGLLAHRRHSLTGIVNGIDTDIWSPETDPELPDNFSARRLGGKKKNRQALIKEFGLDQKQNGPLFTVISRMSPQKGLDLIIDVLPFILAKGGQVIVLGSGDQKLEAAYQALARKHPGQIAVSTAYDEALAHRLIGGADALLMPSLFEPCGLVQLYALTYGTIPVVRATGGLADTVQDNITGFTFQQPGAAALQSCLERVFASYTAPDKWQALMQNAMAEDFSWTSSAAAYADLYHHLLGHPQAYAPLRTAANRNTKKSIA
ncbi:MAG: glycogen synthase GlgA, partial [Pseudomonadota bacterium]